MTSYLRTNILALAATLLLGAVGCAHRVTLDRHRFDAKIATSDANASNIRVYLDHRLKVTYKLPRRGATIVNTDIHLKGRRQVHHVVIGRRTRGKLISIASQGDRPLLYIAFDDRCSDPRCALAFVADAENARFSLADVPIFPPAVTSLIARDRGRIRGLKRGYLRHLAEPAQVYRATRGRRGPLTVDLQVIEHVKPKRVRYRFKPGATPERPGDPPRALTHTGGP